MPDSYYLVILSKGCEPMAVAATDSMHIVEAYPGVALIAKTTKAMLNAAGFTSVAQIEDLERLATMTRVE